MRSFASECHRINDCCRRATSHCGTEGGGGGPLRKGGLRHVILQAVPSGGGRQDRRPTLCAGKQLNRFEHTLHVNFWAKYCVWTEYNDYRVFLWSCEECSGPKYTSLVSLSQNLMNMLKFASGRHVTV